MKKQIEPGMTGIQKACQMKAAMKKANKVSTYASAMVAAEAIKKMNRM